VPPPPNQNFWLHPCVMETKTFDLCVIWAEMLWRKGEKRKEEKRREQRRGGGVEGSREGEGGEGVNKGEEKSQ
jgi:hypothetical protein